MAQDIDYDRYGIDRGDYDNYLIRVTDDYLFLAVQAGYIDLIKYFIYIGATDFQGGLDTAAETGNKEAFDFFVSLGANDFNEALDYALYSLNTEMIEYINNFANKK